MPHPPKQIAIIGGGITGLTAAYYLEKARRTGARLDYKLFEQSSRPGGALLTERVDSCIVEGGADSFLTEKPWAIQLCRELGIENQLIGSNDLERQTFILHKKKLVPLPPGMVFFVPTDLGAIQNSALFSATGKRGIAREALLQPLKSEGRDVSVAAFVERHFGPEMLARVADPLLAGIYGGDILKLSMRAVMPRFLELEQRHGSLIHALKAERSSANRAQPLFTSLRTGMQSLTDALVAQLLPEAIQIGARVNALGLAGGKWRLATKGSASEFDALILAVPAYAAAALLKSVSPTLATLLRKIRYASSATVALGYSTEGKEGKRLLGLSGFGFLVPHSKGRRALACTFVHNKFPNRVPPGRALLRVFFGGVRDEGAVALSDQALVSLARRELNLAIKLEAKPAFTRVHRWPKGTPQYNLGHCDLVVQIEAEARHLPGFTLTGSAYHGLGVPDCVRQGRDAALALIGKSPTF